MPVRRREGAKCGSDQRGGNWTLRLEIRGPNPSSWTKEPNGRPVLCRDPAFLLLAFCARGGLPFGQMAIRQTARLCLASRESLALPNRPPEESGRREVGSGDEEDRRPFHHDAFGIADQHVGLRACTRPRGVCKAILFSSKLRYDPNGDVMH
jgi:hypothetical protein